MEKTSIEDVAILGKVYPGVGTTKKAKGGQNFNEKSVTIYGKTYTLAGLPETQQSNCGVYGLAVKLNRCTAGMNADTYTDKERSAKIAETYETLKGNNWNKPGTGGSSVKKVELEAKVATKEKELSEMGIKLAEAMAMIEKLTAKAGK